LFAGSLAVAVGPSGYVTAVESSIVATKDATTNLTDLPQAHVVRTDVATALRRPEQFGAVDIVVLDPPRSGAGLAVVKGIAGLRPRSIAYVACDPAALARDLASFSQAGYVLDELRAFDMFPQTHHVECVAILTAATDWDVTG